MIEPIQIDGQDHYVMLIHPRQAAQLERFKVADLAAAAFAGRNWRRIKREMNKAMATIRLPRPI